jgi:hypothetical protein
MINKIDRKWSANAKALPTFSLSVFSVSSAVK